MKLIKSIKKAMLVVSASYIAIGVLMIVYKENSIKQVVEILIWGLGIAGILTMIRYFLINVRERFKRDDFLMGALLVCISVLIYLTKDEVPELVNNIIGIAMIVSGLHKIQDLFDTKAAGKKCVGIYLFGFVVCAGLGVVVLLGLIKNINILYVVAGLGMCICGISDIISNFYVAYAVANYETTWAQEARVKDAPSDKEVRHEEFLNNNVDTEKEN